MLYVQNLLEELNLVYFLKPTLANDGNHYRTNIFGFTNKLILIVCFYTLPTIHLYLPIYSVQCRKELILGNLLLLLNQLLMGVCLSDGNSYNIENKCKYLEPVRPDTEQRACDYFLCSTPYFKVVRFLVCFFTLKVLQCQFRFWVVMFLCMFSFIYLCCVLYVWRYIVRPFSW